MGNTADDVGMDEFMFFSFNRITEKCLKKDQEKENSSRPFRPRTTTIAI